MTNNTKKNLIIIALIIIIALLIILFINVINKKEIKKEENNIARTKDQIKESVKDIDVIKEKTKEASVIEYINAIEKQVMLNEIDETNTKISKGTYKASDLKLLGVSYKGEGPSEGVITIDNSGMVENAWLYYKNEKIHYSIENYKAEVVDEFNNVDEITCTIEINDGITTNSCN